MRFTIGAAPVAATRWLGVGTDGRLVVTPTGDYQHAVGIAGVDLEPGQVVEQADGGGLILPERAP